MNQKELFVGNYDVDSVSLNVFLLTDDDSISIYQNIKIENKTIGQSVIIPNNPLLLLYLNQITTSLLKQHITTKSNHEF